MQQNAAATWILGEKPDDDRRKARYDADIFAGKVISGPSFFIEHRTGVFQKYRSDFLRLLSVVFTCFRNCFFL